MSHDPARVAETKSWFVKAASDLRAATHELTAVPPLTDDIVFHAQQAAEKAMKGYLSWHDQPFRRTHDLAEVGCLCTAIDATLEPLLRRAVKRIQVLPDAEQTRILSRVMQAEGKKVAWSEVEAIQQRMGKLDVDDEQFTREIVEAVREVRRERRRKSRS